MVSRGEMNNTFSFGKIDGKKSQKDNHQVKGSVTETVKIQLRHPLLIVSALLFATILFAQAFISICFRTIDGGPFFFCC